MALSLCLALVAVLLVASRDGGERDRLAVEGRAEDAPPQSEPAPEPSSPPEADSGTTVPLVPVTTGVPVPDAVEAPPPTAAPSATPGTPRARSDSSATGSAAGTPGDGDVVTGTGAVLTRPPDTTTTRPVDKAKGCHSAADPGWTIQDCGALRSGGGVLLWVVESKGKGLRTLVLRERTSGRWTVVLSALDDQGSTFSAVGVRGEDVSGDGHPELVFGFHRRDRERTLAVDVVDASPAVVVHRELPQGAARVSKGQLDTWAAAGDGFDHVVIRYASGAWRAGRPTRVARADVPPSMV